MQQGVQGIATNKNKFKQNGRFIQFKYAELG